MSRVLLTAFEPYGQWKTNASWLALVEMTKQLPKEPKITTRLYPVDFDRVRERLEQDLAQDYDFALHLGQAPGSTAIQLETVAINVRREANSEEAGCPLADDGQTAYRANLPFAAWLPLIRESGVPCQLSYHAGVYLCNATLYWNRYLCERHGWRTQSGFVHVPLEPSQTIQEPGTWPCLPAMMVAVALRKMLEILASA